MERLRNPKCADFGPPVCTTIRAFRRFGRNRPESAGIRRPRPCALLFGRNWARRSAEPAVCTTIRVELLGIGLGSCLERRRSGILMLFRIRRYRLASAASAVCTTIRGNWLVSGLVRASAAADRVYLCCFAGRAAQNLLSITAWFVHRPPPIGYTYAVSQVVWPKAFSVLHIDVSTRLKSMHIMHLAVVCTTIRGELCQAISRIGRVQYYSVGSAGNRACFVSWPPPIGVLMLFRIRRHRLPSAASAVCTTIRVELAGFGPGSWLGRR